MERSDGRKPGQLRKLKIVRGYLPHAEGSVFLTMGCTEIICTASVEENRVPQFLRGSGQAWVTAEYGMLPRATDSRTDREAARGRVGGRTQEIQRLIGRSLRAVVDLKALPELTIKIDCDVIRADGGTRTAAITGAYIALVDALIWLHDQEKITALPIKDNVAAVSVGLVDGEPLLDLAYDEDKRADVDMNVVMTGSGGLIEVQGTAEGEPFERRELTTLLNLAARGIRALVRKQNALVTKDIAARNE